MRLEDGFGLDRSLPKIHVSRVFKNPNLDLEQTCRQIAGRHRVETELVESLNNLCSKQNRQILVGGDLGQLGVESAITDSEHRPGILHIDDHSRTMANVGCGYRDLWSDGYVLVNQGAA